MFDWIYIVSCHLQTETLAKVWKPACISQENQVLC
jgi:hypothetical protein